jgi:hypothetical protein
MHPLKNLTLILCGLLVYAPNISSAENIRTALVNVTEAIVYSDPALKNPLGKVPRGEHISIGKPLEKYPQVVPIIVSGRVAYIQLANLFMDQDNPIVTNGKKQKVLFHNPTLLDPPFTENMLKNNAAYFSIHMLNSGEQFQQIFQNIDGTTNTNMTEFSANYLHRQSTSRLIWGAGCDYYTQSSPNVDYRFLFIKPTIGFSVLKKSEFILDLIFSYGFSLVSTFNINNNTGEENGGFIYGADLGTRLIYWPSKKYHPTASLTYTHYGIMYSNDYFDAQRKSYPSAKQINGINLSLGFAVEI